MSRTNMAYRWLLGTILLALTAVVAAESGVRISEPTDLDLRYMQQQRDLIKNLAADQLGRYFNGDKNNDLSILQQLLDRRLVREDQTRELQAMGVIMGDLLAADLDMQWVIYEDRVGRSRALRYRDTENYLFPMTMISRRREADNQTPVVEIYQKAYDIIAQVRPPLPFQ